MAYCVSSYLLFGFSPFSKSRDVDIVVIVVDNDDDSQLGIFENIK